MADRYYGFGGRPPHGYPEGPPGSGDQTHPYPYGPGVVFYPVHPAYFYPPHHHYPPPVPPGAVQVVDSNPEDDVPQLPGETVELPWSKSNPAIDNVGHVICNVHTFSTYGRSYNDCLVGTYRWVPACLSQRSIPMGALRVGTDADGDEIYAGRAHHAGDILPAKVIPSKNACYIAYNGEELPKDQFEVLVPAMFSWQFSTDGNVPPGAVEAGVTADGEKLFFGRVNHDGCTTPGKIHPSHATCYYPFGGEERSSPEYECLVLM